MTVKAELQFVTDAAAEANKAADGIARFRSELEKLQSLSGTTNFGSTPSGKGGTGKGGSAGIESIQARAVAQQAAIAQRNAAKLSEIGASGQSKIAVDRASIAAQSEAAQLASNRRIAEQFQKDRNAILVKGAAASHALMASETAHAHRLIEIDKKGALDANKLQLKGEQDIAKISAKNIADVAKIEAKKKADIEKDGRRTANKTSKTATIREETTSGAGGAARAILEGKGIKGALGAFGGRGAKVAAVGEFALSAGRAAFDAAKQIAGVSFEFGKAVVGAQAFKEDIKEAFITVRGTNMAADATFQTAIASADRLGITRASSIATFLDLATKGFDDAKIKEIQGRLLDITTIDPRASVEGLTKIIGKVAAQGRLTTDILSELSTAGLEQGDVIKEIGKKLGKTDVEVIKALSTAGGIRGLGVDPILSAIAAQTGGKEAGAKVAEKSARNLSSLLRRVTEIPQNVLFDVEVGPGLNGIKETLRSVLSFFAAGSATAKEASRVIGNAFNAIVSGLLGKDIAKEGGDITSFLSDALTLIEVATPGLKAFAGVVRVVATSIAVMVTGVGNLLSILSGDFTPLTSFFNDIKVLTGFQLDGSSIIASATNLGADIVNGLISGIQSGLASVASMASNMGSTVIASVRGALNSHSPSRELIDVGLDATTGLAIGGRRGTPMVAGAFASMATAGLMAAASVQPLPLSLSSQIGLSSSGTPSAMMLPSASQSAGQFTFAPVIQVTVADGSNGDAIASAIEERLRRMIPDALTAYLEAIGGARR